MSANTHATHTHTPQTYATNIRHTHTPHAYATHIRRTHTPHTHTYATIIRHTYATHTPHIRHTYTYATHTHTPNTHIRQNTHTPHTHTHTPHTHATHTRHTYTPQTQATQTCTHPWHTRTHSHTHKLSPPTLFPHPSRSPRQGKNSSTDCTPCASGKRSMSYNYTAAYYSGQTFSQLLTLNFKTSICQDCRLGAYSPTPGSTACTACSDGSTTPSATSNSSSECALCVAGKRGITDASSTPNDPYLRCQDCQRGAYSTTGLVACAACSDGSTTTTGASTSSSDCVHCVAGKRGVTFISTPNDPYLHCITCRVGAYSTPGSTACTACSDGSTTPSEGSTSSDDCVLCEKGTYGVTGGSLGDPRLYCDECPRGQYSSTEGYVDALSTSGTHCTTCPPGQTNDQVATVAAADCYKCSAGKYEVLNLCQNCELGSWSALGYSGNSCEQCSTGTAQNRTEPAAGCLPCPAGKLCCWRQDTFPASDADRGFYANPSPMCYQYPKVGLLPLLENIVPCPRGRYGVEGDSCKRRCPAGTYHPTTVTGATNEASCLDCPVGSYCPPERRNDEDEDDTRKDADYTISYFGKVECPAGTFCSANTTIPTDCPSGTSTNGGTGRVKPDDCKGCAAGSIAEAKGTEEVSKQGYWIGSDANRLQTGEVNATWWSTFPELFRGLRILGTLFVKRAATHLDHCCSHRRPPLFTCVWAILVLLSLQRLTQFFAVHRVCCWLRHLRARI